MQLQDPKGVSPVLYITAVCMFAHVYMALLTFSMGESGAHQGLGPPSLPWA